MLSKITLTLMAGAAMVAMMVAGCSDDGSSGKSGIVAEVVDSVAAAVAFNVIQAGVVSAEPLDGSEASDAPTFLEMSDLLLHGSKLYAAYDGGVIVYDIEENRLDDIRIGEKLNAVTLFNDVIYVGGDNLYTVGDSSLTPVDIEMDGVIKELCSFNYQLLIGTDEGLYSNSMFGTDRLLDEVAVTAIVADRAGVWVGTDGQGLYRWDGVDFQKRYLRRDPSLFDCVNALDFNHGHLYMGTDEALYVFDGGQWQTLTSEDGLPSDRIRSIDASNWVVYIATDAGVVSYFDRDFIPIRKAGEIDASVVMIRDRKIYLGTDDQGLIVKSGPVLKTLVEPKTIIDKQPGIAASL